jgi:hypothetical protein
VNSTRALTRDKKEETDPVSYRNIIIIVVITREMMMFVRCRLIGGFTENILVHDSEPSRDRALDDSKEYEKPKHDYLI